VDRGEAAMRLIHAVRELDRERRLGLETVALHTDADRDARFVRPSHQEALTRCLTTVLGCGAPLRLDAPGLEEPVLAFELPDGGSVSVEFTEDTPDEPDGGRRA